LEDYILSTGLIVAIVIAVILVAAIVALVIIGKRAQKKQEEQQVQLEAMKQTVTMLIIDKKRMKLNEAGLPQAVIEQTPKLLRRSKLPILKVRVGSRVMSLICDEKIFDSVPVKKEVKASVSGIYVTEVKGLRGKTQVTEEKKGFFKNLVAKAQEKAGAKMVK
jgi:type II secretory pathway pseudopilin PulG